MLFRSDEKSTTVVGFGLKSTRQGDSEDMNRSLEATHKRILHFSSIADSCRRDVVPGVEGRLAFNVTSHGKLFF